MRRSVEQGGEQASDSRAPERARRYGSERASSPVTVVTDDDYRCIWRPCEALEVDETGSPPGQ